MYKKIIFWGTPEFSLPSLKILYKLDLIKIIITQPDKLGGRNKKLIISPIKDYALKHNLNLLQPDKLDDNFIKELKKYLPATFVVIAYGKIIPKKILDLSELQTINIHPSNLPLLRGPSPIQTALFKGFNTTAVSLMQIDDKMDHGAILEHIKVNIDKKDNYISLNNKLSKIGAKLLKNNILNYLNNKLKSKKQDHSKATFCKMIKKEDGNINWNNNAEKIYNQVRAFNPWPSTFTKINNLDIKILKVALSNKELKFSKILIEKDKLYIGTNTRALEILKVQIPGKKIIEVKDFLKGYKDRL